MFNFHCLHAFPSSWHLVPVQGKRPILGKGWHQRSLTPSELAKVMQQGKFSHCTGVGIVLGTSYSDFALLAVDVDGYDATFKLKELAKGRGLPSTVRFTSCKPGRYSCLFKVPHDIAKELSARKFKEGLEFRFQGMMSVLPPSIHPETQKPYLWIPNCSPRQCEIALAPDWLIEPMRRRKVPKSSHSKCYSQSKSSPSVPLVSREYSQIAFALSHLSPWRVNDYSEWIRIGMALYSYSPALLTLWDSWSQQSSKYQPGECAYKWSTFHPTAISIATVFYLANLDSM